MSIHAWAVVCGQLPAVDSDDDKHFLLFHLLEVLIKAARDLINNTIQIRSVSGLRPYVLLLT